MASILARYNRADPAPKARPQPVRSLPPDERHVARSCRWILSTDRARDSRRPRSTRLASVAEHVVEGGRCRVPLEASGLPRTLTVTMENGEATPRAGASQDRGDRVATFVRIYDELTPWLDVLRRVGLELLPLRP